MRTSLGGVPARVPDASAAAAMSRRVAVLCAAVLFVVGGIVLAVFWWWTSYHSPRSQAERCFDDELRAGRGCLLSQDWAHVDPKSGLVVAKAAKAVHCGGVPEVWQSPWPPRDPAAYIEGWNDAARAHLDAGEPCGPRFLDRIVRLDILRDRFRRDGASAIPLPKYDVVPVGDHDVRWWGSSVIVRERGAPKWMQPAGGAPVEPELDRDAIVVAALTADEGRTLWVRVVSQDQRDMWYFVVDLITGTNFQVFDANADRR